MPNIKRTTPLYIEYIRMNEENATCALEKQVVQVSMAHCVFESTVGLL